MGEYLELAKSISDEAVDIMEAMRRDKLQRSRKPDRTDVTEADTRVQAMAVGRIRTKYPSHRVDAEEGVGSFGPSGAAHVWDVDPIDGTTDYIEGGTTYGFGIAKRHRAALEMGLFRCPRRNETYWAEAGRGAFLNGRRIQVHDRPFQRGVPYDFAEWDGARFDFGFLKKAFGKPEGLYSAIYQACAVASGRLALAAFSGNTKHDIAPGALIVAEAGGIVTDLYGNQLEWRRDFQRGVVYATPAAHEQFMAMAPWRQRR